MSNRFTMPVATALDNSARPGAGWKLAFFQPSTSTSLTTFSDENRTVANSNPVVADSAGRFPNVFLSNRPYRVVLSTDEDVQVWDRSPVVGTAVNDLGLTWEGEWSDSETYQASAVVSHEGLAFVSRIDDNENNEPDHDTPGHTAEWMLIDLAGSALAATEAARDQARAAAEASGDVTWYDTFAEADADVGNLDDGQVVGVWEDEEHGDRQTRYVVESGSLEFRFEVIPSAFDFSTVDDVEGAHIPAGHEFLRTAGYHDPGDGGDALYRRVGSEPDHLGKAQSADGGWWELVHGNDIDIRQLGAESGTNISPILQAAHDMFDEDDGGRIGVPGEPYELHSTVDLWHRGVTLEGVSHYATDLRVTHTNGPGIRVRGPFINIRRMRIRGIGDRAEHGTVGDNHGIWYERDDVADPQRRLWMPKLEELLVVDHPGHGIVIIGDAWLGKIDQCVVRFNGGHGVAIDRGTLTGRTNLELCGQIDLTNSRLSDNGGHALAIGHPDDEGLSTCIRCNIANLDGGHSATDASVRYSTDQVWIQGVGHEIRLSAFNSDEVGGTFFVRGRQIKMFGNRHLQATRCVTVGNLAAVTTRDITIESMHVSPTGMPNVDPAIVVESGAEKIYVKQPDQRNIDSIITPGVPGAVVDFDGRQSNAGTLLVFSSGGETVPSDSTRYLSNGFMSNAESQVRMRMPATGRFYQLRAAFIDGPGSGETWTYTLRVDDEDTALTAQVTGSASNTGNNVPAGVPVENGDEIAVKIETSSGASQQRQLVTLWFEPTA